MIDTASYNANQKSRPHEMIPNPFTFIDITIKNINYILENVKMNSDREKIKILKEQINRLIEFWKEYASQINSKDEANKVIEMILTSLDYIFSKVKANKFFNLRPTININDFNQLQTSNNLLRFMIPEQKDITDLSSVKWWNCYMIWVLFYHNLLKEIFWKKESDIDFNFYIESNNYHWILTINETFCIDTNNLGTMYNKVKENITMVKIIWDKWDYTKCNWVSDFLKKIDSLPPTKEFNIVIWWKNNLKLNIRTEWDNIISTVSENHWTSFKTLNLSVFKNLTINERIEKLANELSSNKKEIEKFIKIMWKFNKLEFNSLFDI